MNYGRLVVLFSDWLTKRSRVRPVSRSGVTRRNSCFITTAIVATVAEVESSSTFRETCLATEVQKSFMKPIMLHGATPAETCFAAPLHTSFS